MNSHVMPVLVTILILTGTGLASQAFAETTITINTDKMFMIILTLLL